MIIFREKEFARSLVDRDNDLINSSKTLDELHNILAEITGIY